MPVARLHLTAIGRKVMSGSSSGYADNRHSLDRTYIWYSAGASCIRTARLSITQPSVHLSPMDLDLNQLSQIEDKSN